MNPGPVAASRVQDSSWTQPRTGRDTVTLAVGGRHEGVRQEEDASRRQQNGPAPLGTKSLLCMDSRPGLGHRTGDAFPLRCYKTST